MDVDKVDNDNLQQVGLANFLSQRSMRLLVCCVQGVEYPRILRFQELLSRVVDCRETDGVGTVLVALASATSPHGRIKGRPRAHIVNGKSSRARLSHS